MSIPTVFFAGWLWWSWTLPKWRLWAITHVDDLAHLYSHAIHRGVMWPRGHFFEKTEIKSKSHAIKEREIELSYFLDIVKEQLATDPMIADVVKEFQRVFANGSELPEKVVVATALKNAIGLSNYVDVRTGGDIDEVADAQRDVFAVLLEEYLKLLEK